MYIKSRLSHVMCPSDTRTAHSHASFATLLHKMTTDTKGRELQDAGDSGPFSGTRTGGKQVRSLRRGTSPKSGETDGTRKPSRPRSEAYRCRGNRRAMR